MATEFSYHASLDLAGVRRELEKRAFDPQLVVEEDEQVRVTLHVEAADMDSAQAIGHDALLAAARKWFSEGPGMVVEETIEPGSNGGTELN